MPFRNPPPERSHPGGKGRFPGFDVLDEVDRWDDVTAGVVLARLDPQPEVSFFTVAEQATADALFDQLLGQDGDPKVPVLLLVDRRLALGQTDGWRYEDMPEDGQAWRQTLAALDDDARAPFTTSASTLSAGRSRARWSRRCTTPTRGTDCRQRGSGACGPATPAPPSIPTRGPGTRSALAGPPTRGATRRSGSTRGKAGRSPTTTAPTRPPSPSGSSGPSAATPAPPARTQHLVNRFSDATIRARNESAWLVPDGDDRTNHRLRADMRRFADDDEVDIVIVGCGAGGATLMQRLARAGWRVVGLDAGPFWDPDADWVSDEAGSHRLYWTEPRVIAGADPVPLGSNNSGSGRRRLHGPLRRLHAPLSPVRLPHRNDGRGRRRLADLLPGPPALLRSDRRGAAGLGTGLAVG